jgi:serine/threonine-protein kinase HipA
MSRMFSLTKDQAVKEVQLVTLVVDGWKEHFSRRGVTVGDIDIYAQHIDRPFLRQQRDDIRQ